jgi:hypothetical protein
MWFVHGFAYEIPAVTLLDPRTCAWGFRPVSLSSELEIR